MTIPMIKEKPKVTIGVPGTFFFGMQILERPRINVHLRVWRPPGPSPGAFRLGLKPYSHAYVTNTWPKPQVLEVRPRGEPRENRGQKWEVDVKVPFWTLFGRCVFGFSVSDLVIGMVIGRMRSAKKASNDHSNDQRKTQSNYWSSGHFFFRNANFGTSTN